MATKAKRRWVVDVDDAGRIVGGVEPRFVGIHVDDLCAYAAAIAEMDDVEIQCRRQGRAAATFQSKEAAVASLLAANPRLDAFLEAEWTDREQEYRAWVKAGRPGPKPIADIAGDGRFDAFNATWDLHGRHRVTNWLEALYATVPTSRHWAELAERLPVLEEATGLRLDLPEEAERAAIAELSAEDCLAALDRRLDDLVSACRRSRCPQPEAEREPGSDDESVAL